MSITDEILDILGSCNELDIQANCGTGDGGFKPGNRCARGGGGSGGGSGGGGVSADEKARRLEAKIARRFEAKQQQRKGHQIVLGMAAATIAVSFVLNPQNRKAIKAWLRTSKSRKADRVKTILKNAMRRTTQNIKRPHYVPANMRIHRPDRRKP